MARKQFRRSVSLNREFHDAFAVWCKEHGVSMSQAVERLVSAKAGIPLPPGHTRTPMQRKPLPPIVRRDPVILVDEGTAGMLADLVVRERQLHGREVTEGELLDEAITRFLDAQRWPR